MFRKKGKIFTILDKIVGIEGELEIAIQDAEFQKKELQEEVRVLDKALTVASRAKTFFNSITKGEK